MAAQGNSPFAGILYTYWWSLGRAPIGRHEYLDEAVTLAQHGAVSLLPSGFFPWMLGPTSTQADRPLSIVQDINPVKFVPNAAPTSLFFQFAKNDDLVTESQATQFSEAASQPKKIEWYDDIHDMGTAPVVKARQAWLIEQLKLTP